MDGRATIYDVADQAGVSTSTVSRVLNGSNKVKRSTRVRVRQAIEELEYCPSRAAQRLGLRKRKTEAESSSEDEQREHLKRRLREKAGRDAPIYFEGDWTPAERRRVKQAVVELGKAATPTGENDGEAIWIGLSSWINEKKIYLLSPLSDEGRPIKAFSAKGLIRRLRTLEDRTRRV